MEHFLEKTLRFVDEISHFVPCLSFDTEYQIRIHEYDKYLLLD